MLVTAFSLPAGMSWPDESLFEESSPASGPQAKAESPPDNEQGPQVHSIQLRLTDRHNNKPPPVAEPPPGLAVAVHSASCEAWSVGIGVTQGYRSAQEDAFCVDLALDNNTGLLAVFDGHGGDQCALHCVNNLADTIKSTSGWAAGDLHSALVQTFLALDQQVCEACPSASGTTGTVALIRGGEIMVAGVGDSKSILLRGGHIVPMTIDHRPTSPREEARIRCAGGFVHRGRVNACLNVSRALGDAQFKQDAVRPVTEQQVSPEPDVRRAKVETADDFLLICSDGVWNSMKQKSVLRFVRQRLQAGVSPAQTCEQLCKACLEPCCTAFDNVTAILCVFKGSSLAHIKPPAAQPAQPPPSGPHRHAPAH